VYLSLNRRDVYADGEALTLVCKRTENARIDQKSARTEKRFGASRFILNLHQKFRTFKYGTLQKDFVQGIATTGMKG
jgi:hypothetical protein